MKPLYLLFIAIVAAGFFPPKAIAQADAEAMLLEAQGRTTEAEQAWQSVLKSSPENPEALAHLGLLNAKEEHYPEAIAFYRRAVVQAPNLPGLEINLGLAYFKSARFADALKPFSEELRKRPGDQRLTILLGMTHYGMGDYFVAIPYLKRAAERDPRNLPLRLTLAHSCLWSKQYSCVMDVYKQILALNADSAEADMLAGEALDETGDDAGATEQFRAAVRADPKQPNAHFGLGYLLWKQSQFEEAAREFQAELDNDPGQAQARAYLADCYVSLNDYSRAQIELEKPGDESSAMVHRDLGTVYASEGRNDDAAREFMEAIALDPADVAPHWRLAKLYKAMGKKEEAAAEFAKASTMNKESSQALSDKISEAQTRQQ